MCPEAKDGGTISLVETGDTISVDLYNGSIILNVSDKELEARRKTWVAHEQENVRGYLSRYSKNVSASNRGAVVK